jgi:hypothetical protein
MKAPYSALAWPLLQASGVCKDIFNANEEASEFMELSHPWETCSYKHKKRIMETVRYFTKSIEKLIIFSLRKLRRMWYTYRFPEQAGESAAEHSMCTLACLHGWYV